MGSNFKADDCGNPVEVTKEQGSQVLGGMM